jgi:uncharacterized protein (TIGR02246 family)
MIAAGTVGFFLLELRSGLGSASSNAEDDVRAVADKIIAADNARDLNAVLQLYEADAVLLPPNEQPVVGRDAIRPRYEALFRSMAPAIVGKLDEVHVAGEWAFIRGSNSGEMQPLGGQSPPRKLNDVFLMIVRREPDGQWRIARLMWHAGSAVLRK